jgi:hypothetical protein
VGGGGVEPRLVVGWGGGGGGGGGGGTARLDAAENSICAYGGKGAFISQSTSLLASHHTELHRLRLFIILKQVMFSATAVCVRSFNLAVSV